MELTVFPGVLLALQSTCFPLSSFTTLVRNDEIVLGRPKSSCVVEIDWFVMSNDALYHVTVGDGLLEDVVHVRFICCPAFNVIGLGVNVTDVTGTELTNTCMFLNVVLSNTSNTYSFDNHIFF